MSFQNSQLLLLVFLLFVAVINPYSFLNSNFVLNTSLFIFYITLCISIATQLYAWLQQKPRFIIPDIYLYGRTQLHSIIGANFFPDYYPRAQQGLHNRSGQGEPRALCNQMHGHTIRFYYSYGFLSLIWLFVSCCVLF